MTCALSVLCCEESRDWGNPAAEEPEKEPEEPIEKHKPDFGLSGALAKDQQFGNVYKGVVLKVRATAMMMTIMTIVD